MSILNHERLEASIFNLVSVFKHEVHNPVAQETKALERLLSKLKQARLIAAELSPNDHARIFGDPVISDDLLQMITATEQAINEPLPAKAKQENLYHAMAFHYRIATGNKPTISRSETPTLFQKYIALIVCLIDDRPDYDYLHYIDRTTAAYKRLGQKSKK